MASVAFNRSSRNMQAPANSSIVDRLRSCRGATTEVRGLSALLQHENSNNVALVCATTTRHTVVCPLDMERAVAYLRVSTQRQHRSGLGIDAQRAAIQRFAESESLSIIAEFVEAETGKGADALERRPQLAAALSAGKAAKCSVVVAKLDRLSRDVAFVAGLMAQTGAVHGRGARQGCRSLHAASLCRTGRKGAASHIRADAGGAGGKEGLRRNIGKSPQFNARRLDRQGCAVPGCRSICRKSHAYCRGHPQRGREYASLNGCRTQSSRGEIRSWRQMVPIRGRKSACSCLSDPLL